MKSLGRLSALQVKNMRSPGFYADGRGLYLQVGKNGGSSWVFRFTMHGRNRDMGLGSSADVSLAEARRQTDECRRLKAQGGDPIEARRIDRRQASAQAARLVTFRECGEAYIAAHRPSWRNAKHVEQWSRSLQTHVYPQIGNIAVHDIDTAMLLQVLEPMWIRITETASRIRGRIELILDWAATSGLHFASVRRSNCVCGRKNRACS
jgi:hypothetical protein